MNIIDSYYVNGSDGRRNLFFRPAGTEVAYYDRSRCNERETYVAPESMYIIQWEGTPTHDSGYHASYYDNLDAAKAAFVDWLLRENR